MRLRIDFSYNGKRFNGFQKQKDKNTIQYEIEKALESFFDCPISLLASGRTDSGVSAIRQVGHIDISDDILMSKINGDIDKALKGVAIRINYNLCEDIKILNICRVNSDFHARFNAKLKTYCYNFYLSDIEIPYLSQICLWLKEKTLNIDAMVQALKVLEGKHDFTSFCASNTEVVDKVREIKKVSINYNNLGFYTISITGNGFLYNMVRIIVGTILDVGRGKLTCDDVKMILESKNRSLAGKTVPSVGLVLQSVEV